MACCDDIHVLREMIDDLYETIDRLIDYQARERMLRGPAILEALAIDLGRCG